MRIRSHVTTILFVAAAVGVSVYAYVDRGSITDPERALRLRNVFPAFRRDDVTQIEIHRGAEVLTLEREAPAGADAGDPSWRMTSPLATKVDPAAADAFVAVLDYAAFVRKLDATPPGFNPVRAKGTLHMGRVTYHFALGAPAPGGPPGAAYLRLDGEGTMVVTHELADALLQPADALRDKTIVPYLSIELARLEVRGPSDRWTMERIDDTSFRFTDTGRRVSREAIDKVWRAFAELRAESFLDDAVADKLTEKPLYTVVMTPKDGARPSGELVVGEECPGHPDDVVVVRRAPERLAACAPKGILEGLGTSRAELDDARLFAARPDEVEELRIEPVAGGAAIDIARKGSGWHERSPQDRDLAPDEATLTSSWVTAVTEAGGRLLERAPTGAFAPRFRVTLTRADGHVHEVVELAVGELGKGVAARKQDGAFVELPRETSRLLEVRKDALRGPVIWDPAAEGAWVDALSVHCPGVDEELTRTEHGFTLVRPPGLPADTSGALDLAELVMRARAERWVADGDDGTFGFAAHPCHVVVTIRQEGGARRLALALGDAVEGANGSVYARAEGDPSVFTLPQGLAAMTRTVLVDRNVFFHDRATIKKVTVVRRGRSPIVLHREGESLVASGPSKPAPPKAAPEAGAVDGGASDAGALDPGETVLEVLSHLRATAVLHLGPTLLSEGLAPPELDLRLEASGDAGPRAFHIAIGAPTEDKQGRFARIEGVNATYAIANDLLAPLFALP